MRTLMNSVFTYIIGGLCIILALRWIVRRVLYWHRKRLILQFTSRNGL